MPARAITKQLPLLSEAELLVWCARTVVSDELKKAIRRRVRESLDWSIVLGMARYHGVCPLLYRNLAALCSDLVPAKPLTQLRQKVQADALLNRSLAQELVLLCDALTSNGVPVIPIKGATLAVSAYGDLALREFTDLDLLIPKGSIAEAQRVILSQGYEKKANGVEGHQLEDNEGPYHVLIKKRPISRVDLQWVMAHQHFTFRLDRPEFWRSQVLVMLEGKTVPGLAPEILLIVLCVHGSKHAWEQLKWVCDVAELLRTHPELDWDQIFLYTSNWRCRGMLYLGLSLAHRLLDAPLPEMVLVRLKGAVDTQALSLRMPAGLLKNYQEGINEEQAGALYFSLKDSWWERWRFGLLLCRAHSPAATDPPLWFRWRTSLKCLARLIVPLHRVTKRLLSPAIRGTLNRWVPHSG